MSLKKVPDVETRERLENTAYDFILCISNKRGFTHQRKKNCVKNSKKEKKLRNKKSTPDVLSMK